MSLLQLRRMLSNIFFRGVSINDSPSEARSQASPQHWVVRERNCKQAQLRQSDWRRQVAKGNAPSVLFFWVSLHLYQRFCLLIGHSPIPQRAEICLLVLKVIVWRNQTHNFFYSLTDVIFVVLNKRSVITMWEIDDEFNDRHQKQESTWLLTSPLTEANLWLVVPCFSLVSLWVWCYHQDLYLTASSLKWSPMIEKELLCSNFSMSFFS